MFSSTYSIITYGVGELTVMIIILWETFQVLTSTFKY